MDERARFPPGMITLGSFGYTTDDESQKFLSLAKELAWTCYNFYQSTPTKLAGENYFFHYVQKLLEGFKMGSGIVCRCCNTEDIELDETQWTLVSFAFIIDYKTGNQKSKCGLVCFPS
ncbi:hypothetical protein PHAVU_003G092101 [Phaseolus vulgaris]|uniref:mannosyl-oligosaccharide 1,2-alpha-mannosidase MNS1-like isoform X1 n=1 Tax=Phaseolus vulgaris TaxID=3885 RepID=UPI0035CA3A3F